VKEKILFRCKFGSHLYGTNTAASDTNYMGIFMADMRDIVLKQDKNDIESNTKQGYQQRNTADDVDSKYKELRRFIQDCLSGQTYAIDMLFCNKENTIISSPEWEYIQANRAKLLNKNVMPFIGYCRQQVGKYGLRGTRLGQLDEAIAVLEKAENPAVQLIIMKNSIPDKEYVFWAELGGSIYLSVLEKYYQSTRKIKDVLELLKEKQAEYGHRARQAKVNEGIDWKAVSHAYRCIYQGLDLMNTGNISFPLKQASILIDIKTGKYDYDRINEELPDLMAQLEEAALKSSLPEKGDREFWDEFIIKTYLK